MFLDSSYIQHRSMEIKKDSKVSQIGIALFFFKEVGFRKALEFQVKVEKTLQITNQGSKKQKKLTKCAF
jgi:hypothetical protein